MGMGCAGAYADVIEESAVKKFCPKEFQALQDAIDGTSFAWEDIARAGQYEDIAQACSPEIEKVFLVLTKAFEKKTRLSLSIAYHDSESEGDRYDDVNGIYWCVGNMYQLTSAGKKMKKYVDRKMFVQFG